VTEGQQDLSGKLVRIVSFVQEIDGEAEKLRVVSKTSQSGSDEGEVVNRPLPSDVLGNLAEQTHHYLLFLSFDFVIRLVVKTLRLEGRKYVGYSVLSVAGIVAELMRLVAM
jgi:hypothetical protein